jgi:hypothetical protein
MTKTILAALGASITRLITESLVAPAQETAAPTVRRAEWSGRAIRQTRSFGPGR